MTDMTDFLKTAEMVIANADKNVAELESYFSMTCIDAWPFVIVLTGHSTPSACKALGDNRYNFSAQGRDAVQFGRESADANAAHFQANGIACAVIGKYQFFETMLAHHREMARSFREGLARIEKGEPFFEPA